jgi:hypothetical protein
VATRAEDKARQLHSFFLRPDLKAILPHHFDAKLGSHAAYNSGPLGLTWLRYDSGQRPRAIPATGVLPLAKQQLSTPVNEKTRNDSHRPLFEQRRRHSSALLSQDR